MLSSKQQDTQHVIRITSKRVTVKKNLYLQVSYLSFLRYNPQMEQTAPKSTTA
jgi:hypothetical protein